MKNLFLLLFLAGCTVQPPQQATETKTAVSTSTNTSALVVPPVEKKLDCEKILKNVEKTCPKPGVMQAVDLSEPVDQKFLDVAWCLGVRTIIRYGDYPNETIKGKTPKAAERKLIQDNGFAEMFVFQHNNRWANSSGKLFNTFTAARGKADAERMRELYPEVPAWYYGVDFDMLAAHWPSVKVYATEFKKVADKYGKKSGAYSSGYALNLLSDAALIHYRWVSMSTGFRDTKAVTAAKKFDLLQFIDKDCGGKNADFNQVNPVGANFGQYRKAL